MSLTLFLRRCFAIADSSMTVHTTPPLRIVRAEWKLSHPSHLSHPVAPVARNRASVLQLASMRAHPQGTHDRS